MPKAKKPPIAKWEPQGDRFKRKLRVVFDIYDHLQVALPELEAAMQEAFAEGSKSHYLREAINDYREALGYLGSLDLSIKQLKAGNIGGKQMLTWDKLILAKTKAYAS